MIDELNAYRQLLLRDAANKAPRPSYLPIDRYVAASLMQKAIRRGDARWAEIGALRLLDLDQDRFWRRLIVTLFEDIGLHDRSLAWRVFAAKSLVGRTQLEEAWPVVYLVLREMCASGKSQAANHALHLGTADLAEALPLEQLPDWTIPQAMEWVSDEERTLVQRVKAAWMLSGLRLYGLPGPPIHPDAAIGLIGQLFDSMGVGAEDRELARLGVAAGGSILAISAVIAAHNARTEAPRLRGLPDHMPSSKLLRDVPSWVFDQYTRAGKATIRQAAVECPSIRETLEQWVPLKFRKTHVVGNVHFEYESARLSARIQHPLELEMLNRARATAATPWLSASRPLLSALREDWDQFQQLRAQIVLKG